MTRAIASVCTLAALASCGSSSTETPSLSSDNPKWPQADSVFESPAATVFHRHSPDGNQVAFFKSTERISDPSRLDRVYELTVANADGSQPATLSDPAISLLGSYPPTWSPNGEWLACTLSLPGEGTSMACLALVRPRQSGANIEVQNKVFRPTSRPAWGPNSSRLSVITSSGIATDGRAVFQLHVIDIEGAQHLTVSFEGGSSWGTALSWTPDGKSIAMVADQTLYLCDVNSENIVLRKQADAPFGASTKAGTPQWSAS